MRKLLVVLFVLAVITTPSAQPSRTMNSSEIQLALKKLTVTGSVLYVAAHPDDENTALLAYLSKERLLRTGYLAMTRGDGGQNLIGTETGELLGVIRTQELLAARSIDGAEQFFTRAIDFGYSKSSDETLEIWDKEKILSDAVWVIRNFRPDVIITRFTPTIGGHGHHLSSSILAEEAFHAAADPNRFSEQLQFVKPWQATRIVWNGWSRFFDSQTNIDVSKLVNVDLGTFNQLLGQSYTEIFAKSRSMHKSQGFGAAASRGTHLEYFIHTAGDSAESDLFEGIDLTWNRVPGGNAIANLLQKAYEDFDPVNPAASLPTLLKAYQLINEKPDNYWFEVKKKELLNVIQTSAGVWIEAIADDYSTMPGSKIKLAASIVNRSEFPIKLEKVILPFNSGDTSFKQVLSPNQPVEWRTSITVPQNAEFTHPYWLRQTPMEGAFVINDQQLIGMPIKESPLQVKFHLGAEGNLLTYQTQVLYKWVDRVDGELYRSLEIAPKVTVNLNEPVYIFSDDNAREIIARIRAGEANVSGILKLKLPHGWKSQPEQVQFNLQDKYQEKSIRISIQPPASSSEGTVVPIAEVGGETYSSSYVKIDYDHIPIQTLYPPGGAKLVRFNLNKNKERIAYIMGSGDDIPKSLEQIGYQVKLLSDEDIENADLSQFDVIITGIRAYNTRESLAANHQRIMNFIKSGGTVIDQYNTTWGLPLENIGPYPFKISRDRVSVEEAPVNFLNPNHSLLNYPNKITPQDFDNWVQERGLYFAEEWDTTHYETIIASNDPGEDSKEGSLIYTPYGKGHYIYSGLSWFRELPAGVPGAYRLFVNLISVGKNSEPRAEATTK